MKHVIAITGGIGSGKSEVLHLIADKGYDVIDADGVNRELLQDKNYLTLLKLNFKEAFEDNVFNKKILAKIIFDDKNKRLLLNNIAHSRIRVIIEKKISNINASLVFVEVPLLIESGMIDMFDEVIVVTAGKDVKISRVSKRDNITREDVLKRMRSQLDDSELIKVATYIIDNNGTKEELNQKVIDIIDNIINKD